MECKHCNTDKVQRTFHGRRTRLCLDPECLMDRMIANINEKCDHTFTEKGEYLLECEKCGMFATPAY